jgi:hypothetical protein
LNLQNLLNNVIDGVTPKSSTDKIRVSHLMKRLTEGTILLDKEFSDLVNEIIMELKKHLLKLYVAENETYKDHSFYEDGEVRTAGKWVTNALIGEIRWFLSEVLDDELQESVLPIQRKIHSEQFKTDIKKLLIDDRLYMVYYPDIIFDFKGNKTKKYKDEMNVFENTDDFIICYDGRNFIFYIPDFETIKNNIRKYQFEIDMMTLFERGKFDIRILNVELVLRGLGKIVKKITNKYGVEVDFRITFKNPNEEGFSKSNLTADGVLGMNKDYKYALMSIVAPNLGALYQTLNDEKRLKVFKSVITHEFLHLQDYIKSMKTKWKIEPFEYKGSDKSLSKILYITSPHEIQAYAKMISTLLVDFVFNKTDDTDNEIKNGIRNIETKIIELKDYLENNINDTSDYTIIERYISIKDKPKIVIPNGDKNVIVNGIKVWNKLISYVVSHLLNEIK